MITMTLQCGEKTSVVPGLVGNIMVTELVNMDGRLTTLLQFPRVVLITCPIFDRFSGRTIPPDKMTDCAVKSLLKGTITLRSNRQTVGTVCNA